MFLDCGVCVLRSWRSGDEDSLARHANNVAIWENLRDRFPNPYTLEDATAWVTLAASRSPERDFAIEVDGMAVGGIGFELHDDIERVSAEVGYWLGEPFWGRGIMGAALSTASTYAFDAFRLSRIYAVPFASNVASHRLLEKAVYELEGVMRHSAIKQGEIKNQLLFALYADTRQPATRVAV